MKRPTAVVVCFGLAVVIGLVGVRLHKAWHFRAIRPVVPGVCTPISGVVGVEDIAVDPNTGRAFLSICDRRAVAEGKPADGGIYAYDVNRPGAVPVRIDTGRLVDFQPHGISLLFREHEAIALYVVNHGEGRHAIECFEVNGLRLDHRKTISGPQLVSPNDVAAVGAERFYVTNDHGSRGHFTKAVEDYLGLRRSSVVYYDGSRFTTVAANIGYANGIALGPKARRVFVAATTEGTLRVYDRDATSGALTLRQTIDCGTAVDNVDVDIAGAVWIGAHPKPLKFMLHARSAAHRSPSEVLRLVVEPSGRVASDSVFLDSGARLSGSSVGAVYGNRLLIGSVFESFFLDCRISSMPVQGVQKEPSRDR